MQKSALQRISTRLLALCMMLFALLCQAEGSLDKTTDDVAANYKWKSAIVGAGGFAPNIIFSTLEPNLAYLRTDMGGMYRWENARQTWRPLQDSMQESSYFGVESIALDPNDKNGIYAAVGMYRNTDSAILYSSNRGESWQIYPVNFKMGGNEDGRGLGERLAVDPNSSNIIYFGSRHDGLQRSGDKGKSWQQVASFPSKGLGLPNSKQPTHAGISFVIIDSRGGNKNTASNHLIVGLADAGANHLFESKDAGETWAAIPNQPSANLLPVKAELDNRGILYIAYSIGIGPNDITGGAVYSLNLQTSSWTNITPLQPPGTTGGFTGLSLDHQHSGTLVVSSSDRWNPYDSVWRSIDGGTTWDDLQPKSQHNVMQTPFLLWGEAKAKFGWWISGLAINPFDSNHLIYTTGATLYQTRNASATDKLIWTPWDQGIEQTAVITLNSLPGGAEVLSGFGDISGFYHADLNKSPRAMYTNPVFANTNNIDYAGMHPNMVVRSGTPSSKAQGPSATIAYSSDYGKSWLPLHNPNFEKNQQSMTEYLQAGNASIVTSADGTHFVLMTQTPYLTENRGQTWKPVKGLPDWARPVADRKNKNLFYALDFANSSFYVSTDSSNSFARINSQGLPSTIKGDRPAWREMPWPLYATPEHEGDLWFASWSGLFHSIDGGKTFTKSPSNILIRALSFGKAGAGKPYPTLFALGMEVNGNKSLTAIWRSIDEGKSWQKVNDENHQYGQRFRCISGDPKHFGRVYVGTDGRGLLYGDPQ